MSEPKQVGKCILGQSFCQEPDKSRPHMQSVLTTRDTTNILLYPSHLTSHNDILWRMAFDAVLLTVYSRSGQLYVWLLGSGRSAAPANLVILRLCVCRHVSAGRGARSLWPHCVVEGNNKAVTAEALPEACCTNSCPVCPALSWEPAWWRHGNIFWKGVVPVLKWLWSHPC